MIAALERLARREGLAEIAHFLHMAMEAAMPEDEIVALLRRKQEIDKQIDIGLGTVSYDRWMVEALAALLRAALEEKARQRASVTAGGPNVC